ncbi:MAG: UDP-N-acetylmuramoyl-tripeptide--D-alanyl-D-alanine ligase [Bacteroidales bacterium]|nr:UDP-N-acetylmuramoyl-tripeptide--D-alanyl-D-alanine ligase [Bacteroidales bacterium]
MDIKSLYNIFVQHPAICTDTRQISNDSIYFSLKGDNFDGNDFAAEALEKGSAYAVIDDPDRKTSDKYILVNDALDTLQNLALYHRKQLNIPVLGITGTNGKTTTKELIYNILSKKYITAATSGNLNNHIGVPLTILASTEKTEVAVVEMGANHKGEIALLCEIAQPDFGLITNIGKAHLEGFEGIEGVVKAKKELYDYIISTDGLLFVNDDDELLTLLSTDGNRVFYGNSIDSEVSGSIQSNDPFLNLEVKFKKNKKQKSSVEIQTKLFGKYNFENILAAVAVGDHFQVPYEDIKDALEAYEPQNNRSQIFKTEHNTLVLDAYNANPTSMEQAIISFAEIQNDNKLLILGDMNELGDQSKNEHRNVFKLLKKYNLQNIILVGPVFSSIAQESNYLGFLQVEDVINWIKKNPVNSFIILIKGSRLNRLEALIPVL